MPVERRAALKGIAQLVEAVTPGAWVIELGLRLLKNGQVDQLSMGGTLSFLKDVGLLLTACGQETLQQKLLKETAGLQDTPTGRFIRAGASKYFSGGKAINVSDISIPLVDPEIRLIEGKEKGTSSFYPSGYNYSGQPEVVLFTPTVTTTVNVPVEFILNEGDLDLVSFPGYAQHPLLGRIPLVPITFLPNETYGSFLKPTIELGRLSMNDPQFLKFALVKEAAAIALGDAVINHMVSMMVTLGLPRKISATNARTGQTSSVEIISDAILRLLSRGHRLPALLDIASYGIAIDALRSDSLLMRYLSIAYKGGIVNQAFQYNFGSKPEEVMPRSFQWVLDNPYTEKFPHVGGLNEVP